MDEFWRLLHLVAAAYWLGGLMLLAAIAVIAAKTLEAEDFRVLMARAGRAFLVGSVLAWVLLGASGFAMASARLQSIDQVSSTSWGRLLEDKTGLAVAAVVLTALHTYAGAQTSSRAWVMTSRVLSPLIFLVSLGIFYYAVRLTGG